MEPDGLPCRCGKHGCLEAYCSPSRIGDELGVTVKEFFAGLEVHNPQYEALWDDMLRHLAVGIGNIRMTPTVTAYAVDATGALVTKNVSYIESSAVNGTSVSATNLSKGVYKVTTLTDGTYKMEVQNGMTFTAASFNYASGDPTIALSTKGNAATVFYTVNKTSGVPSSVTTTTGMASMGSMRERGGPPAKRASTPRRTGCGER